MNEQEKARATAALRPVLELELFRLEQARDQVKAHEAIVFALQETIAQYAPADDPTDLAFATTPEEPKREAGFGFGDPR